MWLPKHTPAPALATHAATLHGHGDKVEPLGPGPSVPPDMASCHRASWLHAVHLAWRRGVVTGWDARCCEGEEWVAASGAAGLAQGLAQPFYHVLVDQRDWAYDAYQVGCVQHGPQHCAGARGFGGPWAV